MLSKSLHTYILHYNQLTHEWKSKITYSFLYFNRHFTLLGSVFLWFLVGTLSVWSSIPWNVCENVKMPTYVIDSLKIFGCFQELVFFFSFQLHTYIHTYTCFAETRSCNIWSSHGWKRFDSGVEWRPYYVLTSQSKLDSLARD